MKKLRPAVGALLLLWLLPPILGRAQGTPSPAGHWEGAIQLPQTSLGIRVQLETAATGGWSGTIDIPVQGLRGFRLGDVRVQGTNLSFTLPNIPGDPRFEGAQSADGQAMRGRFTQGGVTAPFQLERKPPGQTPLATPARGQPGQGLVGAWQGSLLVQTIELRLLLEVQQDAAGQFSATLESIDQGAKGIPVGAIQTNRNRVEFQVPRIGGAFQGEFNADASELSGQWQQGGQSLPLTFKRLARAPDTRRPQDPRPPLPYSEREVVIPNPTAKVTLAGTLTLPRGPGPHPAVILLSGSGPQDRNETLMGHRPFLVLADHLTRLGVAVLRYDDRGVGQSTGDYPSATHEDFTADALAAVAFLAAQPEMDARRIGLVGHSEGAVHASLAAVQRPQDVAFLALLAGVGVPMTDLLVRQVTDLTRAAGASEAELARIAARQREWLPRLRDAPDTRAASELARQMVAEQVAGFTPEQRTALGLTETVLGQQAALAATPWFRRLLAYDPHPVLRQVKCPVLALNGEKDLQVAARENLAGIRAALTAGGNPDFQVVALPGLNHLFQTCTTGAVVEYGQIQETFSPAALKVLGDWIQARIRAR